MNVKARSLEERSASDPEISSFIQSTGAGPIMSVNGVSMRRYYTASGQCYAG